MKHQLKIINLPQLTEIQRQANQISPTNHSHLNCRYTIYDAHARMRNSTIPLTNATHYFKCN